MHAWHLVLKWTNECLQNGWIFLFHLALATFMSHLVTKLKLLTNIAHTFVEETHLGGQNSFAKQAAVGMLCGPYLHAASVTPFWWLILGLLQGGNLKMSRNPPILKTMIWTWLRALTTKIFLTVQNLTPAGQLWQNNWIDPFNVLFCLCA